MKKKYIFFIFYIFSYNIAAESILNREEWLKKFSEQKIDHQNVILYEIAAGYSFFNFIKENKEIFKKFHNNIVNGRDAAFDMTNEERFKMNIFMFSDTRSCSHKSDEAKQFLDELQRFIFRRIENENNILENLDNIESMAEETKEFFVDAQKIFEQKCREQQNKN